jgi:hypothetical protein
MEMAHCKSATRLEIHMSHPQLFSLPARTDLFDFRRQIIDRPWLALRIELVTFGPSTLVNNGRSNALPWIALLGAAGAIIGAGIGLCNNEDPHMTGTGLFPMWSGGSTAMLITGVIGAAIGSLIAGAVTYISFWCRSASAIQSKDANELLETVLAVEADANEMTEIRAFFSQWKAVEIGRSDIVAAITGREISHRLSVYKREVSTTMIA